MNKDTINNKEFLLLTSWWPMYTFNKLSDVKCEKISLFPIINIKYDLSVKKYKWSSIKTFLRITWFIDLLIK